MLVLAAVASLWAPGLDEQAPQTPPPAAVSPRLDNADNEVEGVVVTGRRPDPNAPRPVPIREVSIAPGGDRLAYVVQGSAGEQVVVQSLSGPVLATIEAGAQKVRRIDWAGEHNLVLVLSLGERGLPQAVGYDLRDRSFDVFLARTPSKTTDGRPPLRGRPNQSVASPMLSDPVTGLNAGEPVSFTKALTVLGRNSFRFDLYRVSLNTGVSKVHVKGGRGTDQYAVAPDGRVLARSDYDRRSGRWRLLAYRSPGWREVLVRDGQDSRAQVLGLGRDGASVLVRMKEGGPARVVEVSLDGGVKPLTDKAYAGGYFARDNGRLVGLADRGPESRHLMFEPNLDQAWPSVLEAFEGQTVSLESWTPDFRRLVVLTESPTDRPTYYLVDLEAQSARRLRPALRDADSGQDRAASDP